MFDAQKLLARWYDPNDRPSIPSRLVAGLYAGLTAARRKLYAVGLLRSTRLPVKVIVVGNITLGGTGKTPLVMALAKHLQAQGWRPGIISRGYGGNQKTALMVPAGHPDPAKYGDEPSLMVQQTNCPLAIGRNRIDAAKLLLKEGVNVIIADDGLQHYRLARNIEICVIDGIRRLGNGHLLPAGPLREPASRLATVDYRIVNGGSAQSGETPMHYASPALYSVSSDDASSMQAWRGQKVHAVAGIGHPERFFKDLTAMGLDVIGHPFPDHHPFIASDLAFDDTLPVIMTAKDAIKCQAFAQQHWWYLTIEAKLPADFFMDIKARLEA